MDPASPAPVVRAPRGLSRGSRAVIAILAVGVGVPLFLGVWIGGILLLDAAGIAVDPDQVLRWLLAGFAGLVLWPVVLHRVRRELWRRDHGEPAPKPTPGDAALRIGVLIVGAIAIIGVAGPRDVIATATMAWQAVSIGRREDGLLLQLAGVLLILLLAAPALIVTHRALKRLGPGHPSRARWQERQTWYFSASLAWVAALGVALVLSFAALVTL
ncbi:hypothetical protein [Microbacterium sp. RURRCA19A]|uniref:hypothetical protein n=1 Tax=Microbacterium sp. RURRCA19A TaxID=1907391 RepID=UPI000970E483|nr:hypothetical protein [Microbacterium sp. RURRCA19A]